MLKYMNDSYGTDMVALLFSLLMFLGFSKLSKEDLIKKVNEIKKSGKMTEEQYQNAVELVNKMAEINQTLKNGRKAEVKNG